MRVGRHHVLQTNGSQGLIGRGPQAAGCCGSTIGPNSQCACASDRCEELFHPLVLPSGHQTCCFPEVFLCFRPRFFMHGWKFVLVRGGRKSGREQRNHVLLYHLAQTVNHPFLKSGSLAAALSRRNEGECTRSWASAETCLKRPKGTTAARLCIRLS